MKTNPTTLITYKINKTLIVTNYCNSLVINVMEEAVCGTHPPIHLPLPPLRHLSQGLKCAACGSWWRHC